MARVLCTGTDPSLMATRALLLESAGHTVVQASSEPEVISACTASDFDVAVIGQSISDRMKQRVFALVKERCPDIKVLELTQAFRSPVLGGADDWLETPNAAPSDLAERVARLADGDSRNSRRA